MKPTKVLKVRRANGKSGKCLLWSCNNGKDYYTKELAGIIGKTPECLLGIYNRNGIDNEKIFRPPTEKVKMKSDSEYLCEVGETVIHNGRRVQVAKIISLGKVDEKSQITVCKMLDDGFILTRSPFFIGESWEKIIS